LAIARKETIQIVRDQRALLIVLMMPVMLMTLLGYGVNLDQNHSPLCVFDREGSQQSQDLLKLFTSNKYFDLLENVKNYQVLTANLDAGRCTLAIVIPNDFSKRLREGGKVSLQTSIDATNDNTANLIIGYAQRVVQTYSKSVQLDFLGRQNLLPFRQGQVPYVEPISIEARTWFNDNLESRNFVVPGVVAIVMTVIGTFLTSLTVAREWERGTMEQLMSTPLALSELIAGKLAPFFFIGMIDAAICIAITLWWFEVPFRGSVGLLLLSTALFLITVLLLGMLISVLAANQFVASQISIVVTFLPSYLLSGFVFPIEQMPAWLQFVSRFVPARYYVAALKSISLEGAGIAIVGTQLLAMAAFALAFGLMTRMSLGKSLA
jgi:ABC-2 type transport system permease protein